MWWWIFLFTFLIGLMILIFNFGKGLVALFLSLFHFIKSPKEGLAAIFLLLVFYGSFVVIIGALFYCWFEGILPWYAALLGIMILGALRFSYEEKIDEYIEGILEKFRD